MERPADLECANSLGVFTFEEEVYPRMRGSLPLEGSTDEGFWFLRGRCKVREGRRSFHRREFDVLFYVLMGGLDGGAL